MSDSRMKFDQMSLLKAREGGGGGREGGREEGRKRERE